MTPLLRTLARRSMLPVGAGLMVAATGAAGLGVGGLGMLTRPSLTRPVRMPVTVLRAGVTLEVDEVTLTTPDGCDLLVEVDGPHATTPGFWSLVGESGRLLVGPPLHVTDGRAVRPARHLAGEVPAGDQVAFDARPFAIDCLPEGLVADGYAVPGPLGPLPVTEIAPANTTPDRAVVYIHGRGADRTDGLWLAPTAAAAGWRTVLVGYRNDVGAPATGRYLLGGEWEDLAAVLAALRADGVTRVVLAGWSMGGNIAACLLRQIHDGNLDPATLPAIDGLVVDAPALDWTAVLAHVARDHRLPASFVPAVLAAGRLLEGIDWRRLDHVTSPDHLALPVLAFHGTDDRVVPDRVSSALVDHLPDATLMLTEGAGHCRSVNHDPSRYLGALRSFLDRVGA